jgi:protein-S-isoprenylcysteine O-methyltransferase Ste14
MFIIAIYFLIWAVVHSVLASIKVKTWAAKWLGEGVQRWYRLFFVIVSVITLTPLLLIYVLQPDEILYQISSPWQDIMRLGQVAALLSLVVTTWQSGLFQFIGLSQVMAEPQHFTGTLVTSGMFRFVRHPLYLFSSLFLWLSPTMTQNQLLMNLLISLYFGLGSLHEEQILIYEFGDAYRIYKKQVPRFIPWPGRYFRES